MLTKQLPLTSCCCSFVDGPCPLQGIVFSDLPWVCQWRGPRVTNQACVNAGTAATCSVSFYCRFDRARVVTPGPNVLLHTAEKKLSKQTSTTLKKTSQTKTTLFPGTLVTTNQCSDLRETQYVTQRDKYVQSPTPPRKRFERELFLKNQVRATSIAASIPGW